MTIKKPNVLFLTSFWPYPDTDGGRNVTVAIFKILKKISNLTTITYIQEDVLNVKKSKLNRQNTPIYLVKWSRKPPYFIFKSWASGQSYYFERDFSKTFLSIVIKRLNETKFDFIIVDKVVPLSHIPKIKEYIRQNRLRTKLIFFSHNVEANLIKDYIQYLPTLKKLTLGTLLTIEYQFAKREEISILKLFDHISSISNTDKDYFNHHGIKNIDVFPPAFFDKNPRPFPKYNTKTIKLLSNLSWIPNALGMKKFLTEVWPLVIKEVPDAKLVLASKKTPRWLIQLINNTKGVKFLGFLPTQDVPTFYDTATFTISPVWMGSGIKLKVLRAFQMERPIIATTKSLEGLPSEIVKIIPNANNPVKLANLIIKYLKDFDSLQKLNQKQKKAFSKYLDPKHLNNHITKLLHNT